MSLNNLVKRLQDIMRNDAGINGDAQRIEQMVWILFLKVYDAKEEIWEFYDENYTSIIPEELRWRNWAVDHKDGKALTGDALLDFVNGKLFPTLKAIEIDENTPMSQIIVRTAFEDNNNYMKDGILLRQVINVIDEIDFEEYEDRHAFGEIYETILRSLQSAGNSGEFYTPRAVTDFMVQMIKPKLGESIADCLGCRVVANDDAGVGVAFGRIGIGVVGEFVEAHLLHFKVGGGCKSLGHGENSILMNAFI